MFETIEKLVDEGLITNVDKYILQKKLDDPKYRIKQIYENFLWDSLKGKYEILMLPSDSEAVDRAERSLDKILDISLLSPEEEIKLDRAYRIIGELYVPGVSGDGHRPTMDTFTLKAKGSTLDLSRYELSESVIARSFYWRYDPYFNQRSIGIKLVGEDEVILTLRQTFSGDKLNNKRLYRYNFDKGENELIDTDDNMRLVTFLQVLKEYHDKRLLEGEPKIEEHKKKVSQPFDGMYI
ncbi:MAG: hypothetical protein ACP5MT_02110 [Candidatus Acidifodinimicrobium sp.]